MSCFFSGLLKNAVNPFDRHIFFVDSCASALSATTACVHSSASPAWACTQGGRTGQGCVYGTLLLGLADPPCGLDTVADWHV
jgi:hypothetical protein